MKIALVTTWDRVCGIADYSKALWPDMQKLIQKSDGEAFLVSLDEFPKPDRLLARLIEIKPDIIHFQHEYGIYGGKNPPKYYFPKLVRMIRKKLPRINIIATAHTVLPEKYSFPVRGRGVQAPVRYLANKLFIKKLRNIWNPETWGRLDGVIVHSKHQVPVIMNAGAANVEVIPHFVHQVTEIKTNQKLIPILDNSSIIAKKKVLVFGFFSPEKGQDVVINASVGFPPDVHLILAGGLRRKEDNAYFEYCIGRINELKTEDRITVTGYVDPEYVDGIFRMSDLVVAPFRETTGSGSLANAMARGVPILCSDLPINKEIEEREPGCLAFFSSGNPRDCVEKILRLLEEKDICRCLGEAAKRYAEKCSPARTAERHMGFYRKLVSH